MKISILSFVFYLIFLTGCGFKVVKQSENMNYDIAEIKTSGDKRINYLLKNKLLFSSKKNGKTLISLDINSNKIKSIKEKNIKNEVTKYQILINVKIQVKQINTDELFQLKISKNGDYSVATQYSQTLSNEKKLIKLLAEDLSSSILDELNFKLNDI